MPGQTLKTLGEVSFEDMYKGSYYTILGCGGDLQEWMDGYEDLLVKEGNKAPKFWVRFTGKDFNNHYNTVGCNQFSSDLNILAFPLDGMDTGKLAMFRLRMEDWWFDDLVDNSTGKAARA